MLIAKRAHPGASGKIKCTLVPEKAHECVFMPSRFSRVRLFATPWTVAHQAPLSMRFSRQEYWSGLPCPPPRDLPDPGMGPASLTSAALAGGLFTTSAPWEQQVEWQRCRLEGCPPRVGCRPRTPPAPPLRDLLRDRPASSGCPISLSPVQQPEPSFKNISHIL